MKICFLQYSLAGGGAERKVCTLANYFVSQGHEVEIGLFGVNKVAYELDSRIKVTYIRRNTYEYNNAFEKVLYNIKRFFQKYFLEFPFDVIIKTIGCLIKSFGNKISPEKLKKHFEKKNDYEQPIRNFINRRNDRTFITMMVSSYLAIWEVMEKQWQGKIPFSYLVMDCNDPKNNATHEVDILRTKYYQLATKVLVMTNEAKLYFCKEIQEKTVVIPNPVRNDLPKPFEGKRRDVIVNYCRLNYQKNLPLLINAFSKFHSKYPQYTLEIYGEGDLREKLEKQIADLNLQGCAKILNFRPDIHSYIKDCAMYVSSSDFEGFGNSVLESLAIGLPVISTDCDFGPRDMIEDHKNGLLVPVGDADALCNAMCEVAVDDELAQKLSENALKVREKYDVAIIGKQWLDLIESL